VYLICAPGLLQRRPPALQRAHQSRACLTARQVQPLIGHLALGQVRPSDITRVLLQMERLGRAASTRRSAYAALRWAEVRLDRRELSISGSLTRRGGGLVVSDPKRQRSRRMVSLSPAMVRLTPSNGPSRWLSVGLDP
jgi:hypothetical protein